MLLMQVLLLIFTLVLLVHLVEVGVKVILVPRDSVNVVDSQKNSLDLILPQWEIVGMEKGLRLLFLVLMQLSVASLDLLLLLFVG